MHYLIQHKDKDGSQLHIAVTGEGLLIGTTNPSGGLALIDLPEGPARQLCDALNKHFDKEPSDA